MSNPGPANSHTPPTSTPGEPVTGEGLHKLESQRRANRDGVRALGLDPYGGRTEGLLTTHAARERYDDGANVEFNAKGKEPGYADRRPKVRIAGRVMLLRDNGKLVWMTLRDDTGDLQVAVSQRDCDATSFQLAKLTDLGDVMIASGRVMKTKTGEVTVWADGLTPGSKALTPPPEKHAGLQDVELRYRQRYVDLWANPETVNVFKLRSGIVSRVRRFMETRGYLEVETPMLQTLAGGAAARPFVTHMNALDISLFMRIAPELYLKRLMVGGLQRVFEVNRNFRNEGLDKQHNPEFTMLEAYHAYGDVETVMELTESMIRDAAEFVAASSDVNPLRQPRYVGGMYDGRSIGQVFESFPGYLRFQIEHIENADFRRAITPDVLAVLDLIKTRHNSDLSVLQPQFAGEGARAALKFGDNIIDYSRPFARVRYGELFERAYGFAMEDSSRAREALKKMHPKAAAQVDAMDHWLVVNELFEEKGESLLDQSVPTFITDYPAAISPLTRPKRDNPHLADRADLFIAGMEVAPHYTELNDPEVQEAKFREQLKGLDSEKNAEEQTFRTFDHDFIRALKVGMPPAGGMGLGIDRLVMILTNQRTIRDVVLFPLMRPEE